MTVANLQRRRKKLRRMRRKLEANETKARRADAKVLGQRQAIDRKRHDVTAGGSLDRMQGTLGVYELAARLAHDNVRKQRYDIERAEAELSHATNAVREPHFERFAGYRVPALPCSEAVSKRVDAMAPKSTAPGVPLRRSYPDGGS